MNEKTEMATDTFVIHGEYHKHKYLNTNPSADWKPLPASRRRYVISGGCIDGRKVTLPEVAGLRVIYECYFVNDV
jgi:hypothetical protein